MESKKHKFNNSNLKSDIEKILNYSQTGIKRDKFSNDVHGACYTIEVNDNSYFYIDPAERNKDFATLKKLLKG